jgi:hypothetical protein
MSITTSDPSSLSVVLVHGAFADSSSWNGVIERLQDAGVGLPQHRRAARAANGPRPPTLRRRSKRRVCPRQHLRGSERGMPNSPIELLRRPWHQQSLDI